MLQEKTKTSLKTIFYPASYLVMTITALLATIAITGLASMLVHYWINGVSDILNDTIILYWIASLLVVIPMHILAYRSVRGTDKSQVTTFSVRFAHGLLGAFLLVMVGSIIILSTWLVALWLNAFFGTGTIDKNLFASTVSLLLTIAWLQYVTKHFQRARTDESRPKYYIITVTVVSALMLILSLVFPVMAYRDVARDSIRSNDLSQVNAAIGDYVDANSALPKTLNDVGDLQDDTKQRLGDYEYTPRGETNFGIFGYTLCTTFARSNDKGRDTGFGFTSHGSGKQCFTRTTISFTKLNEDLAQYFKNIDDGAVKLQNTIQSFLLGAKAYADSEVTQLETSLEGVDGGMAGLQKEMMRLEGNLTGLEGNTGDLDQDMAAVQKFLHDLGCLFGGCQQP